MHVIAKRNHILSRVKEEESQSVAATVDPIGKTIVDTYLNGLE